jgi:hypothetical protein
MALSVVRELTAEDVKRLNKVAERFAKRHDWPLDDEFAPRMEPWDWLDTNMQFFRQNRDPYETDKAYLGDLWQACVCRAVGMPIRADVTIAYGHIGYWVA